MNGQTKKRMARGRVQLGVIALAVLVVLAGLVLWTRNNPATKSNATTTAPPGALTQTSEGGQVTIKVTWQGRNAGPIFAVAMDTHAVDLDGYDLRQLAVLRTDLGQEIQPSGWNAPTGGHHRSGTLSFPSILADGTPLIGPKIRSLELVIRNVAGVPERTFRWTL